MSNLSSKIEALLGTTDEAEFKNNDAYDVKDDMVADGVEKTIYDNGGFAQNDIAQNAFERLFGVGWDNWFIDVTEAESKANFMGQLFSVLGYSILTISAIAFFFLSSLAFVRTANKGSPFGRQGNPFWSPIKCFLD